MSYIARNLLQSGNIIQTISDAQEKLKTSPVGSIQTTVSTRHRVGTIGIEIDTPSSIVLKDKSDEALNVFGDVLVKTKDDRWKITQRNIADRTINVLQLPSNSRARRENDNGLALSA